MAGEKLIFIIFYLTFITNCNGLSKKQSVTIEGGILFEQLKETPVTINAPTVLFHRRLNFSDYEEAVLETRNFSTAYKNFCNFANNKLQELIQHDNKNKYFLSRETMPITEAESFCGLNNARLPEIRDLFSQDEIFKLTARDDIRVVMAGIKTDVYTTKFRFKSDNSDAISAKHVFPAVYFSLSTKPTTEDTTACWGGKAVDGGYINDIGCLHIVDKSNGLAYVKLHNEWRLTALDKRIEVPNTKVICEFMHNFDTNKIQNRLLLKMTSFNCARDLERFIEMSELVISESGRYINFDNVRNDTRSKRQIDNKIFRTDTFEFDLFKGKLIDPEHFCALFNKDRYRTDCSKFIKFIKEVNVRSWEIAQEYSIPDIYSAGFISANVLQTTELITLSKNYNPCYNQTGSF